MNVNGFDITIWVYKSRSFQEHKGPYFGGYGFSILIKIFCNSKFRIAVLHPFSPCAIIRTCSGGDDWPRLFWQNLSSFGISSCSSPTWHTTESAWQKVLFFWNTTLVEVFWLGGVTPTPGTWWLWPGRVHLDTNMPVGLLIRSECRACTDVLQCYQRCQTAWSARSLSSSWLSTPKYLKQKTMFRHIGNCK